jgi:RNA polymerase sigma-70 factor, ECF subfamily
MGSQTSTPSLLGAAFSTELDHVPDEVVPPRAVPARSPAARLDEVLRSEFRNVWRAVRRFGVPEASADDAAQEVFIIAARRFEEIEVGHERRFLFGIAVRVASNFRRARSKRPEDSDTDGLVDSASLVPDPGELLEQKRMRELLDWVLDSIPPDLRAAFVLFELEGFSAPEISELLEIPTGTVASRLRRAREIFRETVARLKVDTRARRGTP